MTTDSAVGVSNCTIDARVVVVDLRAVWIAGGADRFLRAFSRSEKLNQRRLAFLFPLASDFAHQLPWTYTFKLIGS